MSIPDGLPLLPEVNTLVSMPLEKFGPSPVTTTARTDRSAPARAPASARAAKTSMSIALRTSGRAIVTVATELDTSYRTFSLISCLPFVLLFISSSSPWSRLCHRSPLDRVAAVPFPEPVDRAVGRSPPIGSLADAKLLWTGAGDEAARRDPQKPDAGPVEPKRCVQVARRRVDLRRAVGRRRQRTRAGERFEIREAHLDRDGPRGVTAAAKPLRDAIGQPQQLPADVLERVEVALEGLLGGYLFRRLVRDDGAVVLAFRERERVCSRSGTESTLEHAVGQRHDVADGPHTETVERGLRLLADAPQGAARKRVEELVDLLGGNVHDSVGLRVLARELREELVRRDADRAHQRSLGADARADLLSDRGRLAEQPRRPADVEERFVERDLLDERRERAQALQDQIRLRAVQR